MTKTWHQLMHLARAYFHQDYDLEAPTPLEVVKLFVSAEPSAAVIELESDLREVLSLSMSEARMRSLWIDEYSASYDPASEGVQYRQWFSNILAILTSS
jgi:hypothetical protein